MRDLADRLNAAIAEAEPNLSALPEESSPREGWSRKQIVGHLIDSASNNHQRFVRALLADELRWPRYDQNGCVRAQNYDAMPWPELVGLWASYNRFLAHVIAQIPPAKEHTLCFIGDLPPMTLAELAEDYLRHLEHHLQQVAG